MKSPVHAINYKFYNYAPTCLQTCSCKMYYVVHKFPNLSRVAIHSGTHAHLIANGECRKYFQEMKNMVVNKVCCTPTTTISAIVLFTN